MWRVIAIFVVIALIAALLAQTNGYDEADAAIGDFSLDFAAAAPSSYDHLSGGGAFDDDTSNVDVVESLEGADFACGDIVTYFLKIDLTGDGTDDPQTIEADFSFLADTTGQSGVAIGDIVLVQVNYAPIEDLLEADTVDDAIVDDGGSVATLVSETLTGPLFASGSELLGTVEVTDLEMGETVVVRIDVQLFCQPGANPTGNLQGQLAAGRLTVPAAAAGDLTGGAQTIPFKQIGNLALPELTLSKTVVAGPGGSCPGTDTLAISTGDTVTYCYEGEVTGGALYNVQLIDDNGTPGDNSDDFLVTIVGLTDEDGDGDADDLAAGATFTGSADVVISVEGDTTNIATVTGDDSIISPTEYSASDDATVTATGPVVEAPITTVVKGAVTGNDTIATLDEPGGSVVIPVEVQNGSTSDATLTSLTDSPYGDITVVGGDITATTCAIGVTVPAGGSYACSFTVDLSGSSPGTYNDTVTAVLTNDAGTDGASDDANVVITDVASSMSVDKTADPTTVPTEGGSVTYTYTVTNTSAVDTITVTSLGDDQLGDLNGEGTCVAGASLAPGGIYSCEVTVIVPPAVDGSTLINIVTVDATDDDGGTLEETAQAQVDYVGVPGLSIIKEATGVDTAGNGIIDNALEEIDYTITATNSGTTVLTNVTVSDTLLAGLSCVPASGADLLPGESIVCTGTYTVTQEDLDTNGGGDGDIDNTATATSNEAGPVDASAEVPLSAVGDLTIVKDVVPAGQTVAADGDVVTYEITVTNVGNTTLPTPTVSDAAADDPPGVVFSSGDANNDGIFSPGEAWVFSAQHTFTQPEIDAGSFTNTACTPDTSTADPDDVLCDDATVPVDQTPSISIVKSGTLNVGADGIATPGDVITYTFDVQNTGNVTLTGVAVTDPLITDAPNNGTVTCDFAGSSDPATGDGVLSPLETVVCSGEYSITQADIDAGNVDNLATVTGNPPTGDPVTDTSPFDAPVPQTWALGIVKELTNNLDEDGSGTVSLGDTLEYTLTATNSGNTTLSNVVVSDSLTGDLTVCASVAPGGTCVLVVHYVVDQDDVDAGVVNNVGTADSDETPPVDDPEQVIVPQNPSILADKVLLENADEDGSGTVSDGDTLTYRITATNTGDVTLSNVTVDDDLTGTVDAFCAATLAVGASCFVDVTYVVDQDDVDAGLIENVGTVEGIDPNGDPVSDTDPEDVTVPQNPAVQIVKEGELDLGGDGIATPGDVITYSFTVTNTGDVTLTDVTVNDAKAGVVDCVIGTMAPGAVDSTTCVGSYAITQGDIDTGSVYNQAFVAGEGPGGDPTDPSDDVTDDDENTENVPQNPSIDLVKTASAIDNTIAGPADRTDEGDQLTYTFDIANDGNVTLSSVDLLDLLVGFDPAVVCGGIDTLAPGASTTCQATYDITQGDIDAGFVENSATATGEGPQGQPVDDTAGTNTSIVQAAELVVTKTADPLLVSADGDVVDYVVTVSNTGNRTLTPPAPSDLINGTTVVVLTGPIGDDGNGTLDPGETWEYTGSYTVSQGDIDAGVPLVNVACASDAANGAAEDCGEATTNIEQNPSIVIDKEGDPFDGVVLPADRTDEGDRINYTFDVANNGNVTLTNVVVTDPLITDAPNNGTIVCDWAGSSDPATPEGTLSVGETVQCTAEYTVTQGNIDAGLVDNTADVDATGPQGQPVNSEDMNTEIIDRAPDLAVEKSADVDTVDAEGDEINYTVTVSNIGNVTSSPDVSDEINGLVPVPLFGPTDDDGNGTLDPGETWTFTGTYVVTQEDMNEGVPLVNVACADDVVIGAEEDCGEHTTTIVQTPDIDVVKTGTWVDANGDSYADAGEKITYVFSVENTGNVTLTNVTLTDLVGGVTIVGGPIASLAPGEVDSTTFTGEYTLSQGDVDAGTFTNTAEVTGTPPNGLQPPVDSDDDVQSLPQNPSIDLVKTASAIDDTIVDPFDRTDEGDQITYTFTITNDGNVTLDSLALSDALVGLVDSTCDDVDGVLEVGASTECTATYDLTQTDIDNGERLNTAFVTAEGPQDQPVDDQDGTTTPIEQVSGVVIDKEGTLVTNVVEPNDRADEGDRIDYTFDVANTGNVTLHEVVVSDPLGGGLVVSCGLTSDGDVFANDGSDTLDPGETVQCTASYTLDQGDIDNGGVDNVGYVDSIDPNDDPVEDDDPNTEDVPQVPVIQIVKDGVIDDSASRTDEGDVIDYTFEVSNEGNVTLTNVVVTDPLITNAPNNGTITCDWAASTDAATPAGTLSVGETVLCAAEYSITQTDIDNAGVENTADADGTGPLGQLVNDEDTNDEPIAQDPAHTLTKTFVPDQVGEGDVGTLELVYTNTGNVTLTDVAIADDVDERLVVTSVTSVDSLCTDPDADPQTVLCEAASVAPDGTVTVIVEFVALGDDFDGVGDDVTQSSGANYVFYFANGYVLYGSTATGAATLLDADREEVDSSDWSVAGANQDIFFAAPYDMGGPEDLGFQLHLSCSEAFIDGWGSTGPLEGVDHPDWQVIAYDVYRFNTNGFLKDCGQTFPFDVPNTATASATPPNGTLDDVDASDTLGVINIAPIEVSRNRVRRGDVEIQYFNTGYEPLSIEIIRIEWENDGTQLEFASYQDGVLLGIGLDAGDDGCYNGTGPQPADLCRLQANIDPATVIDARSKDWLKLSFDPTGAPDGLTVTIVTDDGATFSYEFGS